MENMFITYEYTAEFVWICSICISIYLLLKYTKKITLGKTHNVLTKMESFTAGACCAIVVSWLCCIVMKLLK